SGSVEGGRVARSRCTGRRDGGVHAGAGVGPAQDVEPVVPDESPQDLGVLREVGLRLRRHDASGIGNGDREPYVVAELEATTNPVVLDEATIARVDHHVHAEPAFVESAFGT